MTEFKEDPQKGQFGMTADTVRYKAVVKGPPEPTPAQPPQPSENVDVRRQ